MTKALLHKNLGKHLRERRTELGITQSEVAGKLGLSSPQFVSNFERGLCSPPLKDLKILIRMYKLNGEELIDLILVQEEKRLRKALNVRAKSTRTN